MAQISLTHGVYPISYAASHLAQLIKQLNESGEAIAITQKGRPQAVLIDTYVYEDQQAELKRLRARLARLEGQGESLPFTPPFSFDEGAIAE